MFFSYIFLFLLSFQIIPSTTAAPNRDEVIQKLYKKIAEAQVYNN